MLCLSYTEPSPLLADMIEKGVGFCKYDNVHLVEHCDIVFLCAAPHQLRYIADDIRGHIKPHVRIYSLVLGFPALKLSSLLQHAHIIKPSYQWSAHLDKDPSLWPMDAEIESQLTTESLLRRISLETEDPHGENNTRYRRLSTIFFLQRVWCETSN